MTYVAKATPVNLQKIPFVNRVVSHPIYRMTENEKHFGITLRKQKDRLSNIILVVMDYNLTLLK